MCTRSMCMYSYECVCIARVLSDARRRDALRFYVIRLESDENPQIRDRTALTAPLRRILHVFTSHSE